MYRAALSRRHLKSFMLSLLAVVCCLPCLGTAAVPSDGDLVLYHDDFDTSPPGTLPAGWDVVWDGAGLAMQEVTDAQSWSGSNSFRLLGEPGWSAVAQRLFEADAVQIGYQFKIFIESAAARGEEHPAFFSYQAEGNLWGTYYGTVRFEHSRQAVLAEDGTVLARWSPGTWYSVRVILDRENRVYDVWLDGAQVGFDLTIRAKEPKLIDALALVSAHAGVAVYYDDVAVFIPGTDTDGDGIPDNVDPCPEINPGLIDLDVNGCIDTPIVIAGYLKEGISPISSELPDQAMACAEGAVVNLELEALEDSVGDMLCVVETLDGAGTQAALDASLVTGIAAQTTALLAIDQAAQQLGDDDPNVIAATTLAEFGIELLEQLDFVGAVSNFLDAITQLLEAPEPALLVEIDDRPSLENIWVKQTKTFAAWGEQVLYTIRVTNVGNVDLTGVRVWQSWSDFRATIGDLAVGESRIVNDGVIGTEAIPYRVRQWDPDPFYMVTSGVGFYGGEVVTDGATATVDIIHPQIDVVIKVPRQARAGELISVQVSVTNTGDVTLRSVWYLFTEGVRDYEFIGDMGPGESRFYYYHYLVPANGPRSIKFSVRALGGRDWDNGFHWTDFGRNIMDWEIARTRVRR